LVESAEPALGGGPSTPPRVAKEFYDSLASPGLRQAMDGGKHGDSAAPSPAARGGGGGDDSKLEDSLDGRE